MEQASDGVTFDAGQPSSRTRWATHIHIVASDDDHVVGGHLLRRPSRSQQRFMRVLDGDGATMVEATRATSSDSHFVNRRVSPEIAFRTWPRVARLDQTTQGLRMGCYEDV